MPFKTIGEFLARLKGVQSLAGGRSKALCPSHADKNPSLSVCIDGYKILVKCQAGCKTEDVVRALGLEMKDLFLSPPESPPHGPARKPREPKEEPEKLGEIDKIYPYVDTDGKELFQVVKYKPKAFRQRHSNGKGGFINNITGITPVLYHLPEVIEAVKSGKMVVCPEGEKDADNLRALGFIATTSCMGAGHNKWRVSYSEVLQGADVVVLADIDPKPEKKKPTDPDLPPPGIAFAHEKCQLLTGVASRVRLFKPPVRLHEDISDWIERGGTKEQLLAMVDALPPYDIANANPEEMYHDPPALPTSHALPEIQVGFTRLRDMTTASLNALHAANNPPFLFVRSGELVRVVKDEHDTPSVEILGDSAVRGVLERTVNFVRTLEKGTVLPVSPPLDVVRDLISLADWTFPPLVGITETPVIRLDGSILTTPGYDRKTELYYKPATGLTLPAIKDTPSESDITAAVALILEVICDFPFEGESSRINAIATLITPVLRPLIKGQVPLALIDKPSPGTGASLLADVVSLIATGRPSAMLTAPTEEEEWRKTITSLLTLGRTVVTIDNVEGRLYATALASVLTTPSWQDRILGRSEITTLPHRISWIATGNNIRLAGDLPRRCYWIRMDAKEARPWQRTNFKHPKLTAWIIEKRGLIIISILTITRAWILAGKPKSPGSPVIGSFEDWSELMGGIFSFVHLPGFLANTNEMYDTTDDETPAWENFIQSWYDELGAKFLTVKALVAEMKIRPSLKEAIPETIGKDVDEKGFSRILGNALTKRSGTRFTNNLIIEKGKVEHHAATWSINTVEDSQNSHQNGLFPNVGTGELREMGAPTPDNSPVFETTGSLGESIPSATHTRENNTVSAHAHTHPYAYGGKQTPQDSQTPLTEEQVKQRAEDISRRLGMDVVHAYELWKQAGEPPLTIAGRTIEDLGETMIFESLSDEEVLKISKWLKIQEDGLGMTTRLESW